jgi:hypothetical protein
MAKNGKKGAGRKGTVAKRSQALSGRNHRWTKKGKDGKFMDQKRDYAPFKGVRKIVRRRKK